MQSSANGHNSCIIDSRVPITVKVIELLGKSEESWGEAAQSALADAEETINEIREIKSFLKPVLL